MTHWLAGYARFKFTVAVQLSEVLNGMGIKTVTALEQISEKRCVAGIESSALRLIQAHLNRARAESLDRRVHREGNVRSPKPLCKPDPLCWMSWCCGDHRVVHDESGKPFSAMLLEQDKSFEGFYLVQLLKDASDPPKFQLWERSGKKHCTGRGELGDVTLSREKAIASFRDAYQLVTGRQWQGVIAEETAATASRRFKLVGSQVTKDALPLQNTKQRKKTLL